MFSVAILIDGTTEPIKTRIIPNAITIFFLSFIIVIPLFAMGIIISLFLFLSNIKKSAYALLDVFK